MTGARTPTPNRPGPPGGRQAYARPSIYLEEPQADAVQPPTARAEILAKPKTFRHLRGQNS